MAQLVWLITGCSSGIGEALVKKILEHGDRVVATARAPIERLKHLEDAGATTLELDVTASQETLNDVVKQAIKAYGQIDVLVPNAGHMAASMAEEKSPETWNAELGSLFFGVVNTVNAVLPHFRGRETGTIAFTNSATAYAAFPGAASYIVAKHAVAGYAKTLALELVEPFNIRPILFEIGFIRTPILAKSSLTEPTIEDYKTPWESVQQIFGGIVDHQPGDVEKLAEGMIDVVKQPNRKSMIVPMGKDSLATLRAYADGLKVACDEYETVASSVERDEPRQGLFAQLPHFWSL